MTRERATQKNVIQCPGTVKIGPEIRELQANKLEPAEIFTNSDVVVDVQCSAFREGFCGRGGSSAPCMFSIYGQLAYPQLKIFAQKALATAEIQTLTGTAEAGEEDILQVELKVPFFPFAKKTGFLSADLTTSFNDEEVDIPVVLSQAIVLSMESFRIAGVIEMIPDYPEKEAITDEYYSNDDIHMPLGEVKLETREIRKFSEADGMDKEVINVFAAPLKLRLTFNPKTMEEYNALERKVLYITLGEDTYYLLCSGMKTIQSTDFESIQPEQGIFVSDQDLALEGDTDTAHVVLPMDLFELQAISMVIVEDEDDNSAN